VVVATDPPSAGAGVLDQIPHRDRTWPRSSRRVAVVRRCGEPRRRKRDERPMRNCAPRRGWLHCWGSLLRPAATCDLVALRRRRYRAKPRVVSASERTLGRVSPMPRNPERILQRLGESARHLCNPFGVAGGRFCIPRVRGEAPRPWALLFDAFGVKQLLTESHFTLPGTDGLGGRGRAGFSPLVPVRPAALVRAGEAAILSPSSRL